MMLLCCSSKHAARGAQVSAYAFTFPDEASEDGKQIRIMLPLLDLLNHGNEGVAACLGACIGLSPCSTCLHVWPPASQCELCQLGILVHAWFRLRTGKSMSCLTCPVMR